ncbi:MAG: SDR family oxidoreductase [Nevskiaceae bacterium]|nr:MAG: SDR family oxidoreductase [Nevskiaceae bacterium]TAM33876.1 MAG: SDR family oxidoreductase [Nevskiaceae bacterium]
MQIRNAAAFVTGANRGLGRAFARALLARGARKVYAAARDPATIDEAGVVPVRLDVTDAAQVTAAAAACGDVSLLINNAGIFEPGPLLAEDGEAQLQRQLAVNLFGPLRITRGFAPVLAANGGGAVINVLSALSWIALPGTGSYGASKSAAWGLGNALRQELRAQGSQLLALHPAYIDTGMTAGVSAPKSSPEAVVARALDGLEQNLDEVLADAVTEQVKAGLVALPPAYTRP